MHFVRWYFLSNIYAMHACTAKDCLVHSQGLKEQLTAGCGAESMTAPQMWGSRALPKDSRMPPKEIQPVLEKV